MLECIIIQWVPHLPLLVQPMVHYRKEPGGTLEGVRTAWLWGRGFERLVLDVNLSIVLILCKYINQRVIIFLERYYIDSFFSQMSSGSSTFFFYLLTCQSVAARNIIRTHWVIALVLSPIVIQWGSTYLYNGFIPAFILTIYFWRTDLAEVFFIVNSDAGFQKS